MMSSLTRYYARYESPGAVRSAVSSGNTLMENAIASYSAKEYDKAIGYLEQVISAAKRIIWNQYSCMAWPIWR